MYKIHTVTKTLAEYEAITRIQNIVWPHNPKTAEQVQSHDAARNPNFLFQRLLIEVDGQFVGCATYGENAWAYQPGKYFIDIAVLPEFENQGLGAALYDTIFNTLAKRDPAPFLLTAESREDKTIAMHFLANRNFKVVMRDIASSLDLTAFQPEALAHHIERVEKQGVSLYSMTELKAMTPDWRRIWYDLEWVINHDHPNPDDGDRIPFETFAGFLDGPHVSTDAYFIAIDDTNGTPEYVGLSGLSINWADPTIFSTEMTGVIRSHRRKGIATALKVKAATFAKARGGRVIHTANEENNPMLTLNEKLGFQLGPAWLSFHNKLS